MKNNYLVIHNNYYISWKHFNKSLNSDKKNPTSHIQCVSLDSTNLVIYPEIKATFYKTGHVTSVAIIFETG